MANKRSILTSDHVNYMVFRYLQEAGFTHSAFTFAHESSVIQAPLDPNSVAPGSLIALLQKGLQFLELESNLEGQDGDVDGDFKMLTPEELLTNDIDALKQLVQERREEERAGGRSQADRKKDKPARDKDRDKEKAKVQAAASKPVDVKAAPPAPDNGGPEPMDEEPSTSQLEVPASSVVNLQGHGAEVYMCSWNVAEPLLASGSGDGTARIWNLAPGPNYCKSTVLTHDMRTEKQKDVTTVDWHPDGSLLATGAFDGLARIWTRDGKLKHTLEHKQGALFALKWNKKGDLLLTGSVDCQAVVWDIKTAEIKQTHQIHTAATLDVDWRTNNSFATCSSDKLIYVFKVGDKEPLKKWVGHTDEVNAIRWDPSGQYLASCSDDESARIWSFRSGDCIHKLTQHSNSIYTLRWSPTGPGSLQASSAPTLATASFDCTVKLWELETGNCLTTFKGHQQPVYSLSFSPNGKYLVTGSMDKTILIWNVADGSLVKTCHGDAGIYEVCWNPTGDKIAACFSNKIIKVLDMRM